MFAVWLVAAISAGIVAVSDASSSAVLAPGGAVEAGTFSPTETRNYTSNVHKRSTAETFFQENTVAKIETMWYLMRRATESHNGNEIEAFKNAYNRLPAHEVLMNFALGSVNPKANPVVSAMESDVLNSRRILEEYTHMLSELIVKVTAVEALVCRLDGRPYNESTPCLERVSKSVNDVILIIRKNTMKYKMNAELYWPSAVDAVMNAAIVLTDVNAMVEHVRSQLDGIRTTDVFSIYGWNDHDEEGSLPHWSPDQSDRATLRLYKHSNDTQTIPRHLVVLRSAHYHEIAPQSFEIERAAYRAHTRDGADGSYLEGHGHFNPSQHPIHGFTLYDITPIVQFTSNATAILREEDLLMTREQRMYSAISWT